MKTARPPQSRFNRNKLSSDASQESLRKKSLLDDIINNNSATELSNDADFCQQLLVDGYVQSFVDFYHLTHRPDPNAPDVATAPKIYTSIQDMLFIRDNLVLAETSRRQGNTAAVYDAYIKLADLYAASMDWRTSVFFHEKCLEVSQLTADARAEMSANHSLGIVSQKMADFDLARKFHERHEEIAKQYDVLEEVAKSNVELYKVYTILARKHESASNFDAALEMYQMCLSAAKKSFDKTAEGDANGKIGTLLLRLGSATKSVSYLREQCLIAQEMGNAEGKCNASSALALAYETLGEKDKALTELKLVHSISEQAGDAALQSKACRALGTLYSKIGRLEDAYEALKTHYHLVNVAVPKDQDKTSSSAVSKLHSTVAASRGDGKGPEGMTEVLVTVHSATIKELDLARSFVGIAKGNLIMKAYIVAIQSDLASLLDWKLTRSDLSDVQKEKELSTDKVARKERAAAGKVAAAAAEEDETIDRDEVESREGTAINS
jgi:tetratricopeptide (TPR) repeat protein